MKRLRPFVVCWSILWTIAFPLIHTHPAHAQGNTGHHPIPLTHTVFSADLPDEYAHYHDVVTPEICSAGVIHPPPLVSYPDLAHPEIGFSALTISVDRKMGTARLLCFVLWAFQPAPMFSRAMLNARVPIELPAFVLLSSSLLLRAPPHTTA